MKRDADYAKEPFEFTVKREHVKGSVVGDKEACAGACALKSIPGVKAAWVYRTRTVLEFDDGRKLRWKNPKSVQSAVERFDNTAGVFPEGTYRLVPLGPAQSKRHREGPKVKDGSLPAASRKRPAYALR